MSDTSNLVLEYRALSDEVVKRLESMENKYQESQAEVKRLNNEMDQLRESYVRYQESVIKKYAESEAECQRLKAALEDEKKRTESLENEKESMAKDLAGVRKIVDKNRSDEIEKPKEAFAVEIKLPRLSSHSRQSNLKSSDYSDSETENDLDDSRPVEKKFKDEEENETDSEEGETAVKKEPDGAFEMMTRSRKIRRI